MEKEIKCAELLRKASQIGFEYRTTEGHCKERGRQHAGSASQYCIDWAENQKAAIAWGVSPSKAFRNVNPG